MAALAATVNQLSGKLDPLSKIWATYVADITKLDEEYAKAIKLTSNYAAAQELLKKGVEEATAAYEKRKAIQEALNDLSANEGTAVE
jgi:hypothetical protein